MLTPHHHLKAAQAMTNLLENQFNIFGFKFGLDPLLGLIPGFGDAFSAFLSAYLVWIGLQLKIPAGQIVLMIWYIIFDFILGILPIVGDVADFVFRANVKNMAILTKYAPTEIVEGEII